MRREYNNGGITISDYLRSKGYQTYDWIRSSGRQYFDTGIVPTNAGNRLITDIRFYSKGGSSGYLFCAMWESGTKEMRLLRLWTETTVRGLCCSFRHGYSLFLPYNNIDTNTFYSIDVYMTPSRDVVILDGRTVVDYTGTPNMDTYTEPLYLFASNDGPGYQPYLPASVEAKRTKLYQGQSLLVRDYIPCYNIATDESLMWDAVEDKFYRNQGTGAFTHGSDVEVNR